MAKSKMLVNTNIELEVVSFQAGLQTGSEKNSFHRQRCLSSTG